MTHPLIIQFWDEWISCQRLIEARKAELHKAEVAAYQVNLAYQKARLNHLKELMTESSLGWCSVARHEAPITQLDLYLADNQGVLSIHRACNHHLRPVTRRLSKTEAKKCKLEGAQDATWLSPYGAGIPHNLVKKYGLPYWDLPIVQAGQLTPAE